MKTIIIDNGSSYLSELLTLVKNCSPVVVETGKLDKVTIGADDLVILSGGHKHSVLYDLKYFAKELELIKLHSGPILGICLGAELIACEFGAKLNQLRIPEHGILKLRATIPNEIIVELSVFESHRWGIIDLPNELEELARSKDGIEIFRHKTRPIYGFQFHPEAGVAPEASRALFERVLRLLNQA